MQQHALLDSMFEGVLVLNEKGRVEIANASLRKLFDLSQDIQYLF